MKIQFERKNGAKIGGFGYFGIDEIELFRIIDSEITVEQLSSYISSTQTIPSSTIQTTPSISTSIFTQSTIIASSTTSSIYNTTKINLPNKNGNEKRSRPGGFLVASILILIFLIIV